MENNTENDGPLVIKRIKTPEEKLDEVKITIFIIIFVLLTSTFVEGCNSTVTKTWSSKDRKYIEIEKNCRPKSIYEKYNFVRRAGCEIFLERYN